MAMLLNPFFAQNPPQEGSALVFPISIPTPIPTFTPWWDFKRQGAYGRELPKGLYTGKFELNVRVARGERIPGLSRRQRRQLRRQFQTRTAPMPTRCKPPCKYPEGICCRDGTCVSSVTNCAPFR